jgi:hypothetical protein
MEITMEEQIKKDNLERLLKEGSLQLMRTYVLPGNQTTIPHVQRPLTVEDIGSPIRVHEAGAKFSVGHLYDVTDEEIGLVCEQPRICGRRPSHIERIMKTVGPFQNSPLYVPKENIITYSLPFHYSKINQ